MTTVTPTPCKPAGRLVGPFFELAAELQNGHDAFERRDFAAQFFGQLFVPFDRDAATVVFDRDAIHRC